MAIEWTLVRTQGFDVEDVDRPRTVIDVCPACEKRSPLVERERVRNLRLLGVPLLAIEHGGRVFQCSHCEVCFAPPEAPARGVTEALPDELRARIDALTARLARADDEVSLWRVRVELASKRGAVDLVREARGLLDRYTLVAETLRAELAPLHEAAGVAAPAAPVAPQAADVPAASASATPAVPPPPPADPLADEMAALRARAAERAAARAAARANLGAPSTPAPPAPAATPTAAADPGATDDFADLKRKLQPRRDAPPEATPSAPSPSSPSAPSAPSSDDEMSDLKRRLRKRDP